jgi:glycosyltransferase involved in cell wall biosynthesis
LSTAATTHVVVSERDRYELLRRKPDANVHVISNGVDTTYFVPDTERQDRCDRRRTLLFVGSMDYHANIDAVTWFVRGPWPAIAEQFPSLHFVIAGRKPAPAVQALSAERVHVTGSVDDLRSLYANAFAVLVPLRVGGGTRLKILEAMAAGVPVISTSLGAEGLSVENGVQLLLADTEEEISRAIKSLLEDTAFRSRLVHAARRLVETEYDWRALGEQLVSIYSGMQ